jgi:hypothetical protein
LRIAVVNENETNVIAVYASESGTRRLTATKLSVDELTLNVNLFLDQIGRMIEKTPSSVGAFQFAEFEVSAEISAKGSLVLLGTGGEAGAKGGLKFVFRRATGTGTA